VVDVVDERREDASELRQRIRCDAVRHDHGVAFAVAIARWQ
jgi:hypothetical protein